MPSIEYSGLKITGGKVFAIFTLLGALGGAAWTGFTFYQDYLDMKEKVLTYTEPDLSGFDKKIALVETQTEAQIELVSQQLDALKSELEIILGEIDLISQVSRELKDDLKTDLRNHNQTHPVSYTHLTLPTIYSV